MKIPQGSALQEFAARLSYDLDGFQVESCLALEEGSSVLVAAPTGSGKTTVAEFAIWLARSFQGHVVYTAPIKALSNQKFNELKAVYGESEVGLLTGDVNVNGDAPILVMTTEVLRNMIYEESARLDNLSHVILDEVHYLADRFRGAVWEEIILHLPERIRLVSLSATVSNAEEFGQWLNAVRGNMRVIVSELRPVPLYQHVFVRGALKPLFVDPDGEVAVKGKLNRELLRLERNDRSSFQRGNGRRPNIARNRINHAELISELQKNNLLPGIIFIFSRKGCDDAVNRSLRDGVRLTTAAEREEIRETVNRALSGISKTDLQSLGFRYWLQGLEAGLASHHAGLIPPFKNVVEKLFQKKLVKVVFATETLALGINMPAKSVVIEQLDKFNGESRVPLSPGEFTQLTGRAGRRGIDTEGHAIIVWENRQDLDHVATLAAKRVYPLRSSFKPTYNMTVNLLSRLDFEYARNTLERSFAQFQADRRMVTVAEEIRNEQTSLAGYEKAIARAKSSEEKTKWKNRIRKLKRQTDRKVHDLNRRTGAIARIFERLSAVLTSLGYLREEDGQYHTTNYGEMLRGIYGERDLLVSECIREGIWRELPAAELAALVAALVYEPRRDEDYAAVEIPRGVFKGAYRATIAKWIEIDEIEKDASLARTEMPHAGISIAMITWAKGAEFGAVLSESLLGAGDFIRVTKQTIDLLEQIALVSKELADTAKKAKKLISRGIIEAASGL